ncbi:MAG: hypothetical protein HYU64_00920 [Armatimonadetes bacterium]|nr:hypothetical protein [Armatimonadota bacterium]
MRRRAYLAIMMWLLAAAPPLFASILVEGTVVSVHPESSSLVIRSESGKSKTLVLLPGAIVIKEKKTSSLTAFSQGDKIIAVPSSNILGDTLRVIAIEDAAGFKRQLAPPQSPPPFPSKTREEAAQKPPVPHGRDVKDPFEFMGLAGYNWGLSHAGARDAYSSPFKIDPALYAGTTPTVPGQTPNTYGGALPPPPQSAPGGTSKPPSPGQPPPLSREKQGADQVVDFYGSVLQVDPGQGLLTLERTLAPKPPVRILVDQKTTIYRFGSSQPLSLSDLGAGFRLSVHGHRKPDGSVMAMTLMVHE